MTLQEFIDFEEYVRCICIGRDRILPIQYDPKQIGTMGALRYVERERRLDRQGAARPHRERLGEAQHALGYDMNSVEFAVRDGVPYAIDFTNPAPDMHIENITEKYFDIVVDWMVDFAVRKRWRTYKSKTK
jgi:hypothetical protein